MSRYIDADALLMELDMTEDLSAYDAVVFEEMVNAMPTADVRENARGRWNPISTTSDARQCSACGFVFGDVKMIRMSPTTSVIQHAYDFAFCPMCGAEMRGET